MGSCRGLLATAATPCAAAEGAVASPPHGHRRGGLHESVGAHADFALVGRDEELELVTAALTQGGCVIAGPMGVGKSRLAGEAARRRGGPSVRVIATGAARSVPFGAFAHVVAGSPIEPGEVIQACLAKLRTEPPDVPAVLLIDDAHLLDGASAALVLAVAQSSLARLLVTLRHGETAPDAVTALWKDLRLRRLDLAPLSRPELRELVESHLGGRATGSVHARVFSMTAGNPLYAHELLMDARSSGALAEIDGCWRWTGRQPALRRLRELVVSRTHDLSAQARTTLEVLAVGGAVGLEALLTVTGGDGVGELQRAGLATVTGEPEAARVEVAHPLFAEVVAAELPVAAAREHRRALAEALGAERALDGVDLLRLATLKLESGERDPGLFLRAGAYAIEVQAGVPGPGWTGGEATLAIRLADAAGPGLPAALLAARARMTLARFSEVAEQLAPFEQEAKGAAFASAAEYVRTRASALHWSGALTQEALDLLERARGWRAEPDWAAVTATLTAWILHDLARPASASAAIRALPCMDALSPALRLDALVVLALSESRLGLTSRCEALEPEILRLVTVLEAGPWQTGWARHVVDGFARVDAARDLRQVDERLRAGRAAAEAAGNLPLAAALDFAVGRLALLRGHAGAAAALLEESVDGMAMGDARNAVGWALAHLTCAHALAGDRDSAKEALARAAAVSGERPDHVRLQLEVERARAWFEASCGRLRSARDRALTLADAAGESLLFEAEAVFDALRFGAPPALCAPRLTALAARADSPRLDACAAYARALAAGDGLAQLCAAEQLAALGLDLAAAEAAAAAAAGLRARGRGAPYRRAAALAARHARRCAGARTPALTRALASATTGEDLTPREFEVAVLAAAGARNAEIAEQMVLSVRTVETYILRACRKLGVERRTELARVISLDADELVTSGEEHNAAR